MIINPISSIVISSSAFALKLEKIHKQTSYSASYIEKVESSGRSKHVSNIR